jgi:hypothetical protein
MLFALQMCRVHQSYGYGDYPPIPLSEVARDCELELDELRAKAATWFKTRKFKGARGGRPAGLRKPRKLSAKERAKHEQDLQLLFQASMAIMPEGASIDDPCDDAYQAVIDDTEPFRRAKASLRKTKSRAHERLKNLERPQNDYQGR